MEREWAGPRQEALQDAGWRVAGGGAAPAVELLSPVLLSESQGPCPRQLL